MNDDFEMNHERAGSGMSRRVFLRAALASGATILTGRAATVLGAVSKKTTAAGENSSFNIGGDLPVNRLGFGAMRLTGEGSWGWPPGRAKALKVLQRRGAAAANLMS